MNKVKTIIFEYGSKEINHLKASDEILGEAIDRIGKIDRMVIPELFPALIYAIIGQQISLKAAQTIWERFQERFGDITAENLQRIDISKIQECGLTNRKAEYISNISASVHSGKVNLDRLYELTDGDVIKELSSLPGIGRWTAEMLLLNSMNRSDIVSYEDIAIRRGMMKLYGLTKLTKDDFIRIREKYSPYGSVASIYLWRISYE